MRPYRPAGSFLRVVLTCSVFCLAGVVAAPAHAAFHLNGIEELYTDASGSLQYIQLFSTFSGQQFVAGQQIQVTNVGATQTHTFTIPTNLPADTLNKHWLIGTVGIAAAGAPTPDFIMPDNFLFIGGGTISFFGANSGPYTALPTDGTLARVFDGSNTNTPNIAQNFAGQQGSVVPEPATAAMFILLAALSRGRLIRGRHQSCSAQGLHNNVRMDA